VAEAVTRRLNWDFWLAYYGSDLLMFDESQ
jgi:hypothetical protein